MELLLKLEFIIICIHCLSSGVFSKDNCKSRCVLIQDCPYVSRTLQKTPLKKSTVQRLLKLTCGFKGGRLQVYCPNFKHEMKDRLPSLDECGFNNVTDDISPYILGGRTTELGAFPWIARLGFKRSLDGEFDYICGGTLITRNFILLAAHCFSDFDVKRFTVLLGEYDTRVDPEFSQKLGMKSFVQNYGVAKIIRHKDYDPFTKQNDIALIKLSQDVNFTEFVRPICLPLVDTYQLKNFPSFGLKEHKETRNRFIGKIAGFGKTGNTRRGNSKVLKVVEVPILSNKFCKKIYYRKAIITSNQMCAGGIAGKDSCAGDSGGSLSVFENQSGRHFQIGIISYGPKICGSSGFPGIYTRVSSYLDWIIQFINQ